MYNLEELLNKLGRCSKWELILLRKKFKKPQSFENLSKFVKYFEKELSDIDMEEIFGEQTTENLLKLKFIIDNEFTLMYLKKELENRI